MTRNAVRELLVVGISGLLITGGVMFANISDNPDTEGMEQATSTVPVLATSTDSHAMNAPATPLEDSTEASPGELISVPAFEGRDIKLVAVAEQPLISPEEAMQAIHGLGVPWALGDDWEGKPVMPAGYYGLATFGSPGPQGGWIGDRNIPLPDGTLLDHIENRPMWIITYSNTPFYGGGCPECPPAVDNNTAYAVDAQTKAVWLVWGFKTP